MLANVIDLLRITLDPTRSPEDKLQAERLRAHVLSQPPSVLATRLGLGEAEMNIVWVLAAISIDSGVRRLVAGMEHTTSGDPTLSTLRRVAYGPVPSAQSLRELGPSGRLRALQLIERSDGGGRELHEHLHTWTLATRVLSLLVGETELDPATRARIPAPTPAIESLAVDPRAVAELRKAMRNSQAVVIASGSPDLGRRTLMIAVAEESGVEVLEVDGLDKDPIVLRNQLREVARECLLLRRVPLFIEPPAEALDAIGSVLVPHMPGLVLMTTGADRPAIRWDRPVIAVELDAPTSEQRAKLWLASLKQGTASDGEVLANRYPLAPALIVRAADGARARGITPDDIHAAVRTVVDDKLGQFARRVRTTQQWDDIVLPEDQRASIVELMARLRERTRVYEDWGFAAKVGKGLGIAALFSGPPGTGKSMCAALVAQELGIDLYQVDNSKISSKWIGETEKNLAALFDAAEASHAMLLFDEADSLFGKRTEQKSSNDRHANAETNYLLQRVESYRGICVLTSNHASNIDPAFQRRLSIHVRFELPDVDERSAIWRAMFPANAPLQRVDFASLARRFDMSGGYIRNAALRAAFLAANEGSAITQAHVERAARAEYEAMGKIAS